ncbi:hypothetical protein D3C86_2229270 [compost metagenome]
MQLVVDPQIDQQCTSQAGRQPKQVKKGKLPVFEQVTPGNLKIGPEHGLYI